MTVPKHWKGVAVTHRTWAGLHALSMGWWWDWTATTGRGITFVPHSKYGSDISDIVPSRPVGSHYMIYNEPDDVDQAHHDPDVAANRYFDAYNRIKRPVGGDPTAKVGGTGLLFIASNGRCTTSEWSIKKGGADYLVAFLNQLRSRNNNKAGGEIDAKFDFYHVHAYRLGWFPGTSRRGGAMDAGGNNVTFGRLQSHLQWLHGSLRSSYPTIIPANVPVWITETSRLDGTVQENKDFMDILCNWLKGWGFDTGIVRRVAWFTTRDPLFVHVHLLETDLTTLTSLGKRWLAKEDNEMFTMLDHGVCVMSGQKNIGYHAIDVTPGIVPDGATAVALMVGVKWNAASGDYGAGVCYKDDAYYYSANVRAYHANQWQMADGVAKLNENGRFYFRVFGRNSVDVRVVISGWWE